MLFNDILYGAINFKGTPYADLIFELLQCPEVQRLRHMRLMNFDVPFIQDLASTKRFPHSVGTCYLAYQAAESSALPIKQKKKLVIAALIHDIGILPYGHLLESVMKTKNPDFSHEKLVYSILTGSYHPTNIYHQILGSESLRLASFLKYNHIKPQEIYQLICPNKNESSAISADVDLDNIDNVHRMAIMLGYDQAKSNLHEIIQKIEITKDLNIAFSKNAIENIEEWLRMRQSIYTMIIAHPECVPYNAFLSKLLHIAVENKVVDESNWFITDTQFESKLLENEFTKELASWLFIRPHYELVDYMWLVSNQPPSIKLKKIEDMILEQELPLPKEKSFYFFWSEGRLISREVNVKLKENINTKIGFDSYSILVSLITRSANRSKEFKVSDSGKMLWRKELLTFIKQQLPNWDFTFKLPKDYKEDLFNSKFTNEQLRLFK